MELEGSFLTGLSRRQTTLSIAVDFPVPVQGELGKCEPGILTLGDVCQHTLLVAPWKRPDASNSCDWPVWCDSDTVHTPSTHSWETNYYEPCYFQPSEHIRKLLLGQLYQGISKAGAPNPAKVPEMFLPVVFCV